MDVAEAIVKILEESNVKHIFGHPGEQIIPFYSVLKDSDIKHILMRHEQGAIHAADGYARTSGDFGVCVSTAGPGALNLTMGLATAFKDSVPMLVFTGDNSISEDSNSKDNFQDIDIKSVFQSITFKSFYPSDRESAIMNVKEAVETIQNEPKGPIHINLPKNVLLDENIQSFINNLNLEKIYSPNFEYNQLNSVISEIKNAKKPLILVGAGVFWGKAIDVLKKFVEINNIPMVHTYHTKSILKDSNMDLGLVGIRGTKMANYAFNNADLIIVLGSRLSERTIATDGDLSVNKTELFDFKRNKSKNKAKIITVNIDKKALCGDLTIHGDVSVVLKELNSLNKITDSIYDSWLDEIYKLNQNYVIEDLDSENIPIKPQVAIKIILESFKENIIVNDAGSHTTWVNLLSEIYSNEKLIYSGSMAPMGYGLPAACGASIAKNVQKNDEKIVLINGDGGFQMNVQELATIASNNLSILIIVLNNSQLGIIRQWEELLADDLRYEVDLENPDFIKLANSYGIEGETVSSKEGLELAIKNLKLDKPYLLEVLIDEEDIPVQ
ncbi:3D-(3,5/4)-trihydroxycyclohexane-1,2-dione hydrolase [Candidatus Methanobinarius endosymbioticus]|uniref:3D-(3,5/4)-trihydroxycyclohexane-1,2-dione hydrolase n=1 Tax=Candidatus Methanobinarius endosymbioticus TaxID=2006182 RepID=A0A366MCA6_9EURY|nr:3D-(3,5/4)-trihydroxycyclohexane-1,2-dione hydrolase [Candidatus Methanobinarius endosymbioticus]